MFRNATMRLVAAHLVLVAASTALVLGFLYWRVGGVIDAEQRAVVEAEIARPRRRLRPRRRRGAGRRRSTSASPTRPTATRSTCSADAGGRRIAGNLAQLAADRGARRRLDHARALPHRPPEADRDLGARAAAAARRAACWSAATWPRAPPSTATLGRALLWALAAIVALALATGWLLSRLVRGRIAEIDGAARGDHGRRARPPGRAARHPRRVRPARRHAQRHARPDRDAGARPPHRHRQPRPRPAEPARPAGAPPRGRRRRGGRPAGARRAASSRRCARPRACSATATALLDISRIEAGIGAEQFTEVELGRLAADVAELYEAAAEERGLDARLRGRARARGARPRPAPGARRCRTSWTTR